MIEHDLILETKKLSKIFAQRNGKKLLACDDINLKFYKGKTLGIVGESGCGKSTLLKMLVQLETPTQGKILFKNEDLSSLSKEELRKKRCHFQMIFQDSGLSFNPRMKVKNIICEPLLNFGKITKSQVEKKACELLKMVELPEDLHMRFAHNMSGGQRQRVGIARALALSPDIIFCDEATSSLDVSAQDKIIKLLVSIQKKHNIAIGFVCHDMALAQSLSHQLVIMYLGNVVEHMPSVKVTKNARHPYTQMLLESIFDIEMDYTKKIELINGEVATQADDLGGCVFQHRCKFCKDQCTQEKPPLKEISSQHFVACFLYQR